MGKRQKIKPLKLLNRGRRQNIETHDHLSLKSSRGNIYQIPLHSSGEDLQGVYELPNGRIIGFYSLKKDKTLAPQIYVYEMIPLTRGGSHLYPYTYKIGRFTTEMEHRVVHEEKDKRLGIGSVAFQKLEDHVSTRSKREGNNIYLISRNPETILFLLSRGFKVEEHQESVLKNFLKDPTKPPSERLHFTKTQLKSGPTKNLMAYHRIEITDPKTGKRRHWVSKIKE